MITRMHVVPRFISPSLCCLRGINRERSIRRKWRDQKSESSSPFLKPFSMLEAWWPRLNERCAASWRYWLAFNKSIPNSELVSYHLSSAKIGACRKVTASIKNWYDREGKFWGAINSITDLLIELQGKIRLQDELRAILQSRFSPAITIGCVPTSIQAYTSIRGRFG